MGLDNCMCCHTDTGAAALTCYLTQSQYTDTGGRRGRGWGGGGGGGDPSADPIMSCAWQGGPRATMFKSLVRLEQEYSFNATGISTVCDLNHSCLSFSGCPDHQVTKLVRYLKIVYQQRLFFQSIIAIPC